MLTSTLRAHSGRRGCERRDIVTRARPWRHRPDDGLGGPYRRAERRPGPKHRTRGDVTSAPTKLTAAAAVLPAAAAVTAVTGRRVRGHAELDAADEGRALLCAPSLPPPPLGRSRQPLLPDADVEQPEIRGARARSRPKPRTVLLQCVLVLPRRLGPPTAE